MGSDPIQESLFELISEKKKWLKPRKKAGKSKESAHPASNVIDIIDVLRKSVATDIKNRKAG